MTQSQPRADTHQRSAPKTWWPGAVWLAVVLLMGQVLLYALLSVLFRL